MTRRWSFVFKLHMNDPVIGSFNLVSPKTLIDNDLDPIFKFTGGLNL